MNTRIQPFVPLCIAILIVILAGCNTERTQRVESPRMQRVDPPRTHMTVGHARAILASGYTRYNDKVVTDNIAFNRREVVYTFKRAAVADPTLAKATDSGKLAFADIAEVWTTVPPTYVEVRTKSSTLIDVIQITSTHEAMMLADALLTLREAALSPDTEDAAFVAFVVSANSWKGVTPKPEMSEEARTYKVLAEDAIKQKDLVVAMGAYCEALDKYPMWSEGHYNAALLAAETGSVDLAVLHMRRYLALAPDAPDASAAKDKLLLWQKKVKQWD